jgi:hypothetical protein
MSLITSVVTSRFLAFNQAYLVFVLAIILRFGGSFGCLRGNLTTFFRGHLVEACLPALASNVSQEPDRMDGSD